MRQLYTCVTQQHDLRFLALAAVICALGCHSTFALGRQAFRCRDLRERLRWVAVCIVATATAVWATHFIGMLAFRPAVASGFAADLTALSFALALLLVGTGFCIVAARPSVAGQAVGGAVAGLAISAMHYTGMAGYRVQGILSWDGPTVVLSVLSGTVLAAAAVVLGFTRHPVLRRLGPVFLLLAICSAHFLGMSAVTVAADPRVVVPAGSMDAAMLMLLTVNASLVVLVLSLASLRLRLLRHRRMNAEDKRLRDLADIAVEGLAICDGDTVSAINRSLERMLGQERDAVLGSSLHQLLPGMTAGGVSTGQETDAVLRTGAGGDVPVRIVAQTITVDTRPHTVIAVRDQRDRLRAEHEMHHLAHHDSLTGLANRRQFGEALAGRFTARRMSDIPFALLTLDLDRFKAVNDTLGHGVGDEVLRRASRRLGRIVRDGDVVARLGGDEFAILKSGAAEAAALQVMSERVIDILSRPFLIDGNIVDIGASVGIAVAPGDGDTPEQLLRNADLALYRAKSDGRGCYRLFEAGMDARVQARRALELDLRRAVSRGEFELYFQPQVDASTGVFDGAEALVRWHHPERGLVSPAEFIPLAEETGLIVQLGEWVLRTACTEAMRWPDRIPVAVNVSPIQFRDARLASTVRGVLAETRLPGRRLEIEITEGALLTEEELTLATLHELRGMGVRISMDDFGTGYSSLSYLRRFPFDKIKIDQSFIRQIPHDKGSASILRAIATLGRGLGMKTTAEGVETGAQADFIVREGCTQLQGYLYSRPVPADAVAELLRPRVVAMA